MTKYNVSNCGVVREYKNGNITIKVDQEEYEKDKLLCISELLFWIDTSFAWECEDVWNPYQVWYNCRLDRVYKLFASDMRLLEEGKTVRLYAAVPDKWDRELLKESGVI